MLTCPLPILLAASLLVTPFRTQNVPPPMSTTKLVTPHADRSIQPPIHVAFAPSSNDSETEAFALLFGKEVHVRRVTSKLDRTQPGRVQSYTDAVVLPLKSTVRPRQVAVRADGEDGKAGEVVVLGWDTDAQCDALWFSTFGGEKASWEYMPLSSTGKANISSALGGFVFQTKEGDLLSCACLRGLVPLATRAPELTCRYHFERCSQGPVQRLRTVAHCASYLLSLRQVNRVRRSLLPRRSLPARQALRCVFDLGGAVPDRLRLHVLHVLLRLPHLHDDDARVQVRTPGRDRSRFGWRVHRFRIREDVGVEEG